MFGRFIRRYHWAVPYVLMAPGLLWLFFFFVVPVFQMFLISLSEGSLRTGGFHGPPANWVFSNYPDSVAQFSGHFARSIVFGGSATALCFLIGYPLAYTIAFRGGRYKNLLLFLVIAPFYTSFLIRTISWKVILGDQGPFLEVVRDGLHIVPGNFSVIGSALAVVAGLTYEFLPFVVLPLFVSLDKVDRRLIEAAKDLYAGAWRPAGIIVGALFGAALLLILGIGLEYLAFEGPKASPLGFLAFGVVGAGAGAGIGSLISESFVRVTFPLSLPGVFAATLLTFIPAMGDYVNAQLLGSPRTQMIGNVIQNRFLFQNDYPTASALAFILMSSILAGILLYARLLGTEELTAGGARA